MLKRTWIIISIMTIMQLHGMDAPNFFSKLPSDIWNLIAYYLTFDDFETEEEFIERTRNEALCCKKEVNYGDEYSINSSCPKVNKIGVLRSIDKEEYLIISDIQTGQELYKKSVVSKIPPKWYLYHRLILAPCADLFAIIHSEYHWGTHWKKVLTVMATDNQQKQKFVIPTHFELPQSIYSSAVAFNKQKTHIIMHGIDNQEFRGTARQASEMSIRHYIIVPLTITPSKPSPEKKTLQHYFAQKRICKQIQ